MDLKSLTDRAKQLLEKRGGTGAAKEDAGDLKDIATGSGSLSDKAKAAAEAMKEPGADEVTTPAAPEAPAAPGPGQERTERGGGGGRRRGARREGGRGGGRGPGGERPGGGRPEGDERGGRGGKRARP